MIACMEMRLRPLRPARQLRPRRRPRPLRPRRRRAGPTTDTRRQTHSGSRGYQSSDGSPVSRWSSGLSR